MNGSDGGLSPDPGLGIPREVLTEELLALSRELWMGTTEASSPQWWDRRIRLCEQGIALTETRADAAPLCATFHVELANTLRTTPTGIRSDNLERAIVSFEKAGQVWTAGVAAEQWATIQENLGKVYDQRILGDPLDNRARAAACYRAAAAARGEEPVGSPELDALLQELADPSGRGLSRRRMAVCERVIELVSPPDDAGLPVWIAAHITLAECLESLPDGDRAENLERAIVALDTALGLCDRHLLPEQWGAAHAMVGVVHYERVRGDPAENLERAIRGYELALQVRTRSAEPTAWAATMNNLANAYWRRVHGDRGQDLETAIGLLDAALTVRTREGAPEEWAASRLNLGNVYQDRIAGDRAQNLEQTIACYRDALSVWRRDRSPDQWAMTMNNLGAAYVQRALGDPATNIETAIVIFESALEVRRRDRSPVPWAETTRNLGNAYCLRVRGTRAQNIDDAISTFEDVLGCPQELFPAEWATAQLGLGNAYSERAHGDRAEDIERAIAAYESALSTSTLGASGLAAAALVGLGNAFLDRVRDGRAENIELAIRHFEDAQRVATRAAMPREWATVQHGLGCAHAIRRLGDRATNLEAAVSAFERALEIRTPEEMPLAWAMTQQNLGGVLMTPELPGDRSALQERALAALEAALGVVSAEAMPFRWAELNNNLGAVHAKRLTGDPAANLRAAAAAFTDAAGVWAEQAAPVAWAQAQRNLGSALGDLSAQVDEGPSRDGLIDQAVACFEHALQVYRAERRVPETLDTATSWGDLAYRAGRWRAAAGAYEVAMDAVDGLYAASVLATSKRSELADGVAVFQRAAYAWAKAAGTGDDSDLQRAVVAVERGRARWLGEALAQDHSDLTGADLPGTTAVARYRGAAARLRDLEGVERRASTVPAGSPGVGDIGDLVRRGDDLLTDELRAAHDELAAAIADVRAIGGRFETFLAAPDFETVASTVSGEDALAYLVGTAAGCVALLVARPDGGSPTVRAVWGVGLASQVLNDLLLVCDAAGIVRGGYLPGQSYSRPWLEESLATALPILGECLVGPLADQLRSVGAGAVTLVACGLLGTLPLHAASYRRNDEQRRLIDEFDVSYRPSARVLATARSLASTPSRGSTSLAGVGNPSSAQPLRFAATELDEVAALFTEPRPFYEDGATKEALTAAATDATYVHLACHGEFDVADPLSSNLRLAREERLTLREILTDRPFAAARLVVASACKTAMFDVSDLPDEVLGLPAGFLSAGTPGVIGTLWSVDDRSTAILMARFYGYHLRGDAATGEGAMTPPRALRRAQQWLSAATVADIDAFLQGSDARTAAGRRDLGPADDGTGTALPSSVAGLSEHPFADPYYWAPFVFLGA